MALVLAACSRSEENLVQPIPGERAAFPVWVPVNPAAARASDLNDLWFSATGAEGWAVGSAASILHFAGGKWHPDTVTGGPASVVWTSVALSDDATTGFAVGSHGWIARYLGAHRWTATQEADVSDSLTSVWIDGSGREGFAVGRGATFLQYSGGTWSKVALPHMVPERSRPADVAANEEQVWVRHKGRVSVFTRPSLAWVRDIQRFQPEALWAQPPSQRIWIAGVSYRAGKENPKGGLYTIRWYESDRSDSVSTLQDLPHAGWIETGPLCGVVLERAPGLGEEPQNRSEYVTPKSSFSWLNPDSADLRALWVNQDCSDGWGVGTGGFVARLRLQHFRISSMREEVGPLEEFDGRLVLVLDSGAPRPRLDGVTLLTDQDMIQLKPGEDVAVDTTAHQREIRLEITPAGTRKAMWLKGSKVKLRFHMSYAGSTPAYPIVYERAGTFSIGKQGWWERIPGWFKLGGALVLAMLVVLASSPLWKFVFSKHGSDILDGTPVAPLPKLMVGWLMVFPKRRWKFFQGYREHLKADLQKHPPPPLPPVEVVSCPETTSTTAPVNSAVQWRDVFRAALERGHGLLWVETPSGQVAKDLTRAWAELVLQEDQTPVLIDLGMSMPIEDQIKDKWEEHGEIASDILSRLWTAGGFVFLLDGSSEVGDGAAAERFVLKYQRRNLMILCRPAPPSRPGTCHLRASPPPI